MKKTCNLCKKEMTLGKFAKKKHGLHGVRARCKICTNAGERSWYGGRPRENRNRHLVKTYGITIDEYDSFFLRQSGLCAICWLPERAKNKSLAIDHNHKTGRVRGLLCHKCNAGMGQLDDNVVLLKRAIEFLQSGE